MQSTVDIILPNYNKQPYIKECLNSLVNQSYQNWRCIVVDNYSDDGSWETIQEFANQDSRFEIYQIPKPKVTFYETWNWGLTKVKNPYFCILTSDDVWEPNWVKTAFESLTSHPNAVCAAARTKLIDANSNWRETPEFNTIGERFFGTQKDTPEVRDGLLSSIASYFIGPIYTTIHSLVMRSEILKGGEKFSEDVGSIADCEWYIRLGFYGDIIYHPEVQVAWRIYEGQATQHGEQEKYLSLIKTIHTRTQEEVGKRLDGNLVKEFKKMAQNYDNTVLTYHLSRPYLVNLRNKPSVEFPKLLKILFTFPREVVLDILYKIKGKYFYYEACLQAAERFSQKMVAANHSNN